MVWYHQSMNREDTGRDKEIRKVAEEALEVAKNRIVTNMRFMDTAVFALRDIAEGEAGLLFCTDGSALHYTPEYILSCSRKGLSEMVHNYLHVLLHCIFRHHRIGKQMDRRYWNIATDMAVEALIQSFENKAFSSVLQDERRRTLAQIRTETSSLSAERIYKYLSAAGYTDTELQDMQWLFRVDSHHLWYGNTNPEMEVKPQEDEDASMEDADSDSPDWDKISQMVKLSLEAEERGEEKGELLAALNRRTIRHMDYSTFLRKFTLFRENLRVDDNDFDYIFYTYGLELYGDMPLIEPLEYTDERTIRDLVIVIDTSASTEGELVEKFLERTMDILSESREIRNRFNIHVLQCDTAVQDDRILRSPEDVKNFMDHFEIRGMGGTDYRSAFRYVNELVEKGTFSRLQGLLYFTDGKGIYPKRKPGYDTAFIFEDEEAAGLAKVPSWAMKVVLGGNDEY